MKGSHAYIVVIIIMVVLLLNNGFVSADDVQIPVYDYYTVSQYGGQYVHNMFQGIGHSPVLTIPLEDVFKYPTIVATNYFGIVKYEYVPNIWLNVNYDSGSVMYFFKTGVMMHVFLALNSNYFKKNLAVDDVNVVMLGQALSKTGNTYSYKFSVLVPEVPMVNGVDFFMNTPSVDIVIPPDGVDKLVGHMPSAQSIIDAYQATYSELVKDYRNAKTLDEKRKIAFSYYYFVRPAYYVVYTIQYPYVFIIVRVDDFTIKTSYYEYKGPVNFLIPLKSSNWILYRKMQNRIVITNDYPLLPPCTLGGTSY